MAIENAMHVVIAMPSECLDHPVVKNVLQSGGSQVAVIPCQQPINNTQATNTIGMLRREMQCMAFYKEAFSKASKEHIIDHVIITMFDDAAVISGVRLPDFGNTPWLGIVMRQKFHFSKVGALGPPDSRLMSLKGKLFVRMLKRMHANSQILTIDESLKHYISSTWPAIQNRITYMPDPVDNRGQVTNPELRKQLGIPDNAFLILAYGTLRPNKGVELLLDTLHSLPDNVHAFLVGRQSPQIEASVNSEKHKPLLDAKRIHQVNRYIDVSEDPDFFIPSNAVWLAYHNYYAMSAVMVQAAQYHRTSIATENGLVGLLTGKYQTGLLVDTNNPADLHDAVVKLINKEFDPVKDNFEAFADAYSLSAFENVLLTSINHCCSANDN